MVQYFLLYLHYCTYLSVTTLLLDYCASLLFTPLLKGDIKDPKSKMKALF